MFGSYFFSILLHLALALLIFLWPSSPPMFTLICIMG